MLTKTDLNKIRKIIREETETESKNLKEELQAEIKLARIENCKGNSKRFPPEPKI